MTKKRGYSRWAPEEEEALRVGVEKYGEGKWKRILADASLTRYLAGRTNVDLKDKWRTLACAEAGRAAPGGRAARPAANAASKLTAAALQQQRRQAVQLLKRRSASPASDDERARQAVDAALALATCAEGGDAVLHVARRQRSSRGRRPSASDGAADRAGTRSPDTDAAAQRPDEDARGGAKRPAAGPPEEAAPAPSKRRAVGALKTAELEDSADAAMTEPEEEEGARLRHAGYAKPELARHSTPSDEKEDDGAPSPILVWQRGQGATLGRARRNRGAPARWGAILGFVPSAKPSEPGGLPSSTDASDDAGGLDADAQSPRTRRQPKRRRQPKARAASPRSPHPLADEHTAAMQLMCLVQGDGQPVAHKAAMHKAAPPAEQPAKEEGGGGGLPATMPKFTLPRWPPMPPAVAQQLATLCPQLLPALAPPSDGGPPAEMSFTAAVIAAWAMAMVPLHLDAALLAQHARAPRPQSAECEAVS